MTAIRVQASARLHMGMFDVGGSLGRHFGGVGVAVKRPALIIEATPAPRLSVEGPEAERVETFARRYLEATGAAQAAHLRVIEAIPGHVGLGSGTKLGLTVARALARLNGHHPDPLTLARTVSRGRRSAIGLWTFVHGGFIVEGGRYRDRDRPAPLLMRHPMPAAWRCVLVIPALPPGLSGSAEVEAFQRLDPPPGLAAEISHLVLMSLLPGLVEANLPEFGAAVTRLQQLVGQVFGPVQAGYYTHPRAAALIEAMLEAGASGAGQSSWGPSLYGLAGDAATGQRIAAHLRPLLDEQGWAEVVEFDNAGVQITSTEKNRGF